MKADQRQGVDRVASSLELLPVMEMEKKIDVESAKMADYR